jgi:hypothetical protein
MAFAIAIRADDQLAVLKQRWSYRSAGGQLLFGPLGEFIRSQCLSNLISFASVRRHLCSPLSERSFEIAGEPTILFHLRLLILAANSVEEQ